jgi:hypothetical protein
MCLKDNSNKKQNINNLLLVSGSGRNSGKTTLACEIIKNLSKTMVVYALKISPHFHQLNKKQELLVQKKGFSIFRETDEGSTKDSSRMLKAGAKESLYLQCEDAEVPRAFRSVMQFIPAGSPIVCESGSLAKSFRPGLHLLVGNENMESNKNGLNENKRLADQVVCYDGTNFNLDIKRIAFDGKTWNLK